MNICRIPVLVFHGGRSRWREKTSEKAAQESGDEELLSNTGPELLTAPPKIFIKRLLLRKKLLEAQGT